MGLPHQGSACLCSIFATFDILNFRRALHNTVGTKLQQLAIYICGRFHVCQMAVYIFRNRLHTSASVNISGQIKGCKKKLKLSSCVFRMLLYGCARHNLCNEKVFPCECLHPGTPVASVRRESGFPVELLSYIVTVFALYLDVGCSHEAGTWCSVTDGNREVKRKQFSFCYKNYRIAYKIMQYNHIIILLG